MKKRTAFLSLLCCSALILTACSSGSSTTDAAEAETEAVAEAEEIADEESGEQTASAETPQLTITSDILGLCDTGNKTTLKVDLIYTSGPGDIDIYYYNDDGVRVVYENEQEQCIALDPVTYTGSAVLDLGDDVDDSLIDSSNAVVKLIDGNAYYADEMILSDKASKLDGEWSDGKYTYTLDVGDLEWNTWGYDTSADYNSGREWSIMGGDGCGYYPYVLEVSGILYDGEEVAPATFSAPVYCYGRSSADIGMGWEFVENTYDTSYTSGIEQTDEVQWSWYTENTTSMEADEPYLNDEDTDYFSVIWPAGTDASGITADDVTIMLYSNFGDEYQLSVETPYGEHEYDVISSESETEIFVTYQQWAFVPVFSSMEITIANGDDVVSKTYDVSSVSAYPVGTGGGGVAIDHTTTCFNYYGIGGMTQENSADTTYTLSAEIEDENGEMHTYYYAEDADGNGYLAPAIESLNAFGRVEYAVPDDAWYGDATDIYHIAVLGNVVFYETRMDTEDEIVETEVKTIDGEDITFTRNCDPILDTDDMIANGAYLEPGYNRQIESPQKWAWTKRYQSGWTTTTPQPVSGPYVDGYYGYGYEPGSSNPIYDDMIANGVTK